MNSQYNTLLTNQHIPGRPIAAYDVLKKTLVHIYQNLTLEPANLQKEVEKYLSRKESYSGHVVIISKIKDERITYHMGKASIEVSIVTDYIPWRLHSQKERLSFESALAVLNGACRGFRELLHRVRFPFPIQGSMIGMDENGEVKVWWNEVFHKSGFGFTMSSNIKLKEMVRSLMEAVLEKTEVAQTYRLQALLSNHIETFAILEQRIEEVSIGIDFKNVGNRLILNEEAHIIAINQCQNLGCSRENVLMQTSRSSNQLVRPNFSSEKVILSPRRTEPLEFNQKVITKRTYRDGTSPQSHEKLKIIKQDIQKLRSVVDKSEPMGFNQQSRLRSSRSVESLFSYRKGLSGNTSIPEIKKIIKEAQIIDKSGDIEVSRFVEPHVESTTSILYNPENFNSQNKRKEQQQQYQNNSLFLSRLKNVVGKANTLNQTSRSIKMGTLISTQASKQHLSEFQKKIPQKMYFTSAFEQ